MQPAQMKAGLTAGILVITLLIAIGVFVGKGLVKAERAAYERGAQLAALYYQCRQTFPRPAFLEEAFSWGDPKTCEDVDSVEELARQAP